MTSILKRLTARRTTILLFLLIFTVLLAVSGVNFYGVYNILFRFREATATVIALSISLTIFPFVSVPAVESIVEHTEKLHIKVSPNLVKDYVDGCFTVSILATIEVVLIIAIQLIEEIKFLLILIALALLLTLIIDFFIIVYSLWVVSRLLQELAGRQTSKKLSISIDQVADVAGRSWDEIKRILEDKLKREGLLRADAVADALIEEAKTRASAIVKEQLGSDVPELTEKVAKYIIAFALATRDS